MLSLPSPNDDARTLWRYVVECTKVINAISNMTVVIEGKVHMLGRLTVTGDSAKLEIKEGKEVSG